LDGERFAWVGSTSLYIPIYLQALKLLFLLFTDTNHDQPVVVRTTLRRKPSMPTAPPDLKPKESAKLS
jgi:hypothetical protein